MWYITQCVCVCTQLAYNSKVKLKTNQPSITVVIAVLLLFVGDSLPCVPQLTAQQLIDGIVYQAQVILSLHVYMYSGTSLLWTPLGQTYM